MGTDDLDSIIANSPVDLGEVVLFTRGERSWRLTVPKDGSLPMEGLLPAFIEWSPGPHASTGQQDLDVRLNKVQLTHPEPDRLRDILKTLKVDHLAHVTAGQTALSFAVETPKGPVILN
ncbi:VOC family protein [uncultured Roseobacter sp.]|uniref:VOC family protein n=1 Tax=uncultured Roseobacter sp. TaxID=114847 RepID=UPI0026199A89|nr:VOC family protein [uncultured Roseobacter sp.]